MEYPKFEAPNPEHNKTDLSLDQQVRMRYWREVRSAITSSYQRELEILESEEGSELSSPDNEAP